MDRLLNPSMAGSIFSWESGTHISTSSSARKTQEFILSIASIICQIRSNFWIFDYLYPCCIMFQYFQVIIISFFSTTSDLWTDQNDSFRFRNLGGAICRFSFLTASYETMFFQFQFLLFYFRFGNF